MSHQLPAINGILARETTEYTRHQPDKTLLYRVIAEYFPEFLFHLSEIDKSLPQYVQFDNLSAIDGETSIKK